MVGLGEPIRSVIAEHSDNSPLGFDVHRSLRGFPSKPSVFTAATSSTPSSGDSLSLPPWVGPVAWAFLALALIIVVYALGKQICSTDDAEQELEEQIYGPSPSSKRSSISSETTLVEPKPQPRISRLAPPPPAYIARASLAMPEDEAALYRLTGANTWHNKLASQASMADSKIFVPPILRPDCARW